MLLKVSLLISTILFSSFTFADQVRIYCLPSDVACQSRVQTLLDSVGCARTGKPDCPMYNNSCTFQTVKCANTIINETTYIKYCPRKYPQAVDLSSYKLNLSADLDRDANGRYLAGYICKN